jgi:hypothetical protein
MRRRTGEGDNLNKFCLLPSEGWEKVPDRADKGLLAEGCKLKFEAR